MHLIWHWKYQQSISMSNFSVASIHWCELVVRIHKYPTFSVDSFVQLKCKFNQFVNIDTKTIQTAPKSSKQIHTHTLIYFFILLTSGWYFTLVKFSYVHLIFAIRPIYHPNKLNSVPLSPSQTQFKYIRNKIQSPLVWVINLWIQLKWL